MDQVPEYSEEELSKTICEVKSKRKLGNTWVKGDFIWVKKPVSDLKGHFDRMKDQSKKDKQLEVRCPHCHGPIRLAFQDLNKGKHSKPDHFEHIGEKVGATDRLTCRAGDDFPVGGEHKMSIRPIE